MTSHLLVCDVVFVEADVRAGLTSSYRRNNALPRQQHLMTLKRERWCRNCRRSRSTYSSRHHDAVKAPSMCVRRSKASARINARDARCAFIPADVHEHSPVNAPRAWSVEVPLVFVEICSSAAVSLPASELNFTPTNHSRACWCAQPPQPIRREHSSSL